MNNGQEKTEKNPKGAGAPRIQIDIEELDKLCQLQCTLVEIAGWFKYSVSAIEDFIQREFNVNFNEYYEQKKGLGKIALRRAQMQNAINGNATLQIWLGKNMLGQVDSHTVNANISGVLSLGEKRLLDYCDEEDVDAVAKQIENEEKSRS